jgi:hypothetical protein
MKRHETDHMGDQKESELVRKREKGGESGKKSKKEISQILLLFFFKDA